VHPPVRAALTLLFGWWPVSAAEVLLLAGCAWALWRMASALRVWLAGRRSARNLAGHGLAQVLGVGGVLFLLFQLLWGLHHARLPFAEHAGLRPTPADTRQLARVVELLATRAAARRPADAAFTEADWLESVLAAYDSAGKDLPVLAGPDPSVRQPWISTLLTWASITGIYSPFTAEPHVNGDLPPVLRPFVTCHEIAHQRGFAREDEANFIAWWVGNRSTDPAVAYSCELQAWRIARSRLYAADPNLGISIDVAAPPQLLRDDKTIRLFWEEQPKLLREPLTWVATTVNDAYLKGSGHADGVRSYGRMVDLLIAALPE